MPDLGQKDFEYEVVKLFGERGSRGSFNDAYDEEKYKDIEEAYKANDYAQFDTIRDSNGTLYLRGFHTKKPNVIRYHKLEQQVPIFGLDVDDEIAADMMMEKLLKMNREE